MTDEPKLPKQPVVTPTGTSDAMASMVQEEALRAEIAANVERKKARKHRKLRFHKFGGGSKHGTKPNRDPLVPGGALARRVDHEQHEQAKLLSIGIDCRKHKPSVAERRRMRQKAAKE